MSTRKQTGGWSPPHGYLTLIVRLRRQQLGVVSTAQLVVAPSRVREERAIAAGLVDEPLHELRAVLEVPEAGPVHEVGPRAVVDLVHAADSLHVVPVDLDAAGQAGVHLLQELLLPVRVRDVPVDCAEERGVLVRRDADRRLALLVFGSLDRDDLRAARGGDDLPDPAQPVATQL